MNLKTECNNNSIICIQTNCLLAIIRFIISINNKYKFSMSKYLLELMKLEGYKYVDFIEFFEVII